MQKLGSLKNIVQDKLNTISNNIQTQLTSTPDESTPKNTSNPATSEPVPLTNDPIPWHNFTLKQLLQISQQNQWNDVNKDITTLILSLSKYNPTKPQQMDVNIDTKTEQKTDTKSDEKAQQPEPEKIVSYLREELTCNICLDCYIEPLTLSCGHTFCRLCIMQINSKCEKKCPLCKTCSHIDPTLHSQNVVIQNCVKKIFSPKSINQRTEQLNKEKENLKRNIPVFILNIVRYPGMMLDLHLFEPRYLHMINRAISSGNRFAYLSTKMNGSGGYQPCDNDIATLIKIKECQFLPDGRCLMQGIVEKRIVVTCTWVEKGTQGLWYIKYSDYMDKDLIVENNNGNKKLELIDEDHLEVINKFVSYVYGQSNATIKSVENECGARISLSETNMEQWSFWICSLTYTVMKKNVSRSWIKNQLYSQDTLERIQSCFDVLKGQAAQWCRTS